MTRTERYKVQYFATIAGSAVVGAILLWIVGIKPTTLIVVALLLVLPGRTQGYLWRDLYTGRRLLESGHVRGSIIASEQFIGQAKSKPWLARLWWLQGAMYTRNPVAMASNNIGAANLELGEFDAAKRAFSEAIALDSEYAVPHFNLALIANLENNRVDEKRRLDRAAALGYSQSAIDNFVQHAASILARFEGASRN